LGKQAIKDLTRRNKGVEYESYNIKQSKVKTKVKILEKKVKLQGQKFEDLGHSIK
jgi:hypothetical protein